MAWLNRGDDLADATNWDYGFSGDFRWLSVVSSFMEFSGSGWAYRLFNCFRWTLLNLLDIIFHVSSAESWRENEAKLRLFCNLVFTITNAICSNQMSLFYLRTFIRNRPAWIFILLLDLMSQSLCHQAIPFSLLKLQYLNNLTWNMWDNLSNSQEGKIASLSLVSKTKSSSQSGGSKRQQMQRDIWCFHATEINKQDLMNQWW